MGRLMRRWGGGRGFFGLFLALTLGTLVLCGFYYRFASERIATGKRQELDTVASITADFLARWRAEKLAEAESVLADPGTNRCLASVVRGAASTDIRKEAQEWLGRVSQLYEFKSATLTDAQGNAIIGAGDEGEQTGEPGRKRIKEAVTSGKPLLSDLHFNKTINFVHLDLVAPLQLPTGEPLGGAGALLFRVDPSRSLYPQLRIWPGAGATAERFIVRRDKGQIVYLSPLKYKKDAPLLFSLPQDARDLLSARVVAGEQDVAEGEDYRQVAVLWGARPVPGTDWIVITKMDSEEVMAPIQRLGMELSAGVLLLLMAAGGVGLSQWRAYKLQRGLDEAKALDEERLRFQSLAECAPFGFVLIEPDGRISYINARFNALFGYDRDEVPTMEAWRRKAYPEEPYRKIVAGAWKTDSETTPQGQLKTRVFEVACKDGSRKTVRFYSSQLPTGQILMTLNDITEQAASRAKLQASEERFRRFFEETPAACYVASPQGALLTCNPAYRGLFGYASQEEAVSSPKGVVFCSEAARSELLAEISEHGRLALRECAYPKSNGKEVLVLETASTFPDNEGKITAITGFMVDVTRRKQLEEQLRQAQRMESIGQLAGGVAHDFNNLLQAIMGSAEILQRGLGAQSPWQNELDTVQRTAGRAAGLTKQLLAFSRQTLLAPEVCDPNELVEELLPIVTRLLPESIQVDFIPGQSAGAVFVDKTQFEQALLNLCVNARDAMPQGGAITIETTQVVVNGVYITAHPWAKKGRYVLLSVTDNGTGMAPEVIARAFEPFFTTKAPGKGTGMGLSTVYGIVKQHGGMVNIYSEPGKGTTVKLYFPVAEQRASEVGPRVAGPSRGGSEKVLVVEDEREVQKVVAEVLRSLGYDVLTAFDGEEALSLIREDSKIQLVLSDVVMPRMGGREMMEAARALRPELRFLLTSGYSENAVHHGFILDPAINFLSKPYGMDTLARKVREILDA